MIEGGGKQGGAESKPGGVPEPSPSSSHATPDVVRRVGYLKALVYERGKRGLAGGSRWAVMRAGLDLARRYGWLHDERHVAVRASVRQLAERAGLSKGTTQKALVALEYEEGMVKRIDRGEGAGAGAIAFIIPEHAEVGTFDKGGGGKRSSHVPGRAVSERIYRLRHGGGRIGKKCAMLIEIVAVNPGISRAEIAAITKDRRADNLSRPLKKLVNLRIFTRTKRGIYELSENWERAVDRERTLSGEKVADVRQIKGHKRERDGFRARLEDEEVRRQAF